MKEKHQRDKKLSGYWISVLVMATVVALFNLIAFLPKFCDFYRKYVYKNISNIISFLTAGIPFAVGEIVMYLGMLLVIFSILFYLSSLFFYKKQCFKPVIKAVSKTLLMIVIIVLVTYTFTWSIPIRASRITFDNSKDNYSINEIQNVRNYILSQMEFYAGEVARGENGEILYNFDMNEATREAVRNLNDKYPLFTGIQVPMKKAFCSDFLQWMNIGGYTYPFTMEITYNRYTTKFNYPVLYSHELAHHNGYYREDEAEFLGIIAMIESDNSLFRYMGYYNAYFWINDAYYAGLVATYGNDKAFEIYKEQPKLSNLILEDKARDDKEFQDNYEASVNQTLENAVKPYAEDAAKVGWETQADMLGDANYDGVVKLILDYYYSMSLE